MTDPPDAAALIQRAEHDGTRLAIDGVMTQPLTGRICEKCKRGQRQGRAVSRYLGQWLCVQCAGKTFGPKRPALGNRRRT